MQTEPDFATVAMIILAVAGIGFLMVKVANIPHK